MKVSLASIRVVARCREAVASIQLCVVQHNQVSTVSLYENLFNALAIVLVVSTVQEYSTGSGSPSEDWEELAISLQKQKFLFLCSAFVYCQIYTPDSAIYSLQT